MITPVENGISQTRGKIRAVAVGLYTPQPEAKPYPMQQIALMLDT